MTVSRTNHRMQPLRRPADLEDYVGQWVALQRGKVVFAGKKAIDVADWLETNDSPGMTTQFVARSRGLKVGLG